MQRLSRGVYMEIDLNE